jgi:hypothetical protein
MLVLVFLALTPGGTFQEPPGLEGQLQKLFEKLKSEDSAEREGSAKAIVHLGHEVVPLLEKELDNSDPNIRGAVPDLLKEIYASDPLYLVRPPRRVRTLRLPNLPFSQVVGSAFEPFSLRPSPALSDPALLEGEKKSPLVLDHARFWDVVRAVSEAFDCTFEVLGTESRFVGRTDLRLRRSVPRGEAWVIGTPQRTREGRVRIVVQLLMEPGWQPLSAAAKKWKVESSDGLDWSDKFREDPAPVPQSVLPAYRGLASLTIGSWTATADLPDPAVRIRGTASVVLPNRVEGIRWSPGVSDADRSRTLGGCTVTLEQFKTEGNALRYCELRRQGPEIPEPSRSDFRSWSWCLLGDREGRYLVSLPFPLWGQGSLTLQGGRPEDPDRIGPVYAWVLRPLSAETIEVPFVIDNLRLAPASTPGK